MSDAMVIGNETVFWVLAAISFALTIVIGLLLAMFWYGALIRARAKGYRGSVAGTVIAVSVGGGAALPVVLIAFLYPWDEPSLVTDLSPFIAILLVVITAAAASVGCWLVSRALPPRTIHRTGAGRRRRRHQYQRWSYVTGAATPIALPFAWQDGLNTTYQALICGAVVTAGLRRLERRFRSQDDITNTRELDQPHVLYLRPFLTESRPAYRLPDAEAEFTGNGLRYWVALDEYLAKAVRARLGGFLALGNPSEVLPLFGATRVYLSDDDWQAELMRLADRATAIVMEPVQNTNSLEFELQYLAQKGLHERVFALTPTKIRSPLRGLTPFVNAILGWGTVTWSSFAEQLEAVTGWSVGRDDPGPGAVLTFDATGSSTVLGSRRRHTGSRRRGDRLAHWAPTRQTGERGERPQK